ncbi:COX15/CtaA family protein [Herbiconiux sp. KACC 21604]|uniref:COX15/CtaA family protein n=1 Tax=unclassified Herbiconiux TaxID=2618217 RepID=UPI001490C6B8|nr:COX15/CtaA family protein [Herbiconiux sp. SALV-R1]QJU53548.1 heme A synthase [Herbiconiux sp. SALV-R1]WPO88529.1 COX15/CtaA family protein [Herbiconiux sp. KACC 21604]
MQTPFGFLADRVTLSPRALRWGTTAALVVSILIIITGGVVRVTGSGLGCPTWPACDDGSLTTTPELGIHGFIEFANRVLTGVLIAAVGWAIVAARLQKPRERSMTRLAWSQFWLVVVNALAGGVTVLTELNPWVVAMHFVMAIALLTTTTLTWHRAHRGQTADASFPRWIGALAWVLVIATAVLILVGTLVTGTGPHAGDSADVPRMAFVWEQVTVVHGVLGVVVLVLGVVLLVGVRRVPGASLALRRVVTFVVVVVLQAALGIAQALLGLPEWMVVLHLLGSALVWVGALRVLLDLHPRLFAPRPATTYTMKVQEHALNA